MHYIGNISMNIHQVIELNWIFFSSFFFVFFCVNLLIVFRCYTIGLQAYVGILDDSYNYHILFIFIWNVFLIKIICLSMIYVELMM